MTLPTDSKGLVLDLYRTRHFGTYAERNLLHDVTEVTLVGVRDDTKDEVKPLAPGSRVFAATKERPPVVLNVRNVMGRRVLSIVPLSAVEEQKWTMAGGSYAATSDSRFADLTKQYGAIAVHDWYEGE